MPPTQSGNASHLRAALLGRAKVDCFAPGLQARGPDHFGGVQVNPACGSDATNSSAVSCRNAAINSNIDLSLYLAASLLQLRGHAWSTSPLSDDCGNVLCYNGEIFDGLDMPAGSNDGKVLLAALQQVTASAPAVAALSSSPSTPSAVACKDLEVSQDELEAPVPVNSLGTCSAAQATSACCDCDTSLVRAISRLRGPWSLIYWQARQQKLWFGRDVMGRRSLLMQMCSANSSQSAQHPHAPCLVLTSVASRQPLQQPAAPWLEVPPGLYSITARDLQALLAARCVPPYINPNADQLGQSLDPQLAPVSQAHEVLSTSRLNSSGNCVDNTSSLGQCAALQAHRQTGVGLSADANASSTNQASENCGLHCPQDLCVLLPGLVSHPWLDSDLVKVQQYQCGSASVSGYSTHQANKQQQQQVGHKQRHQLDSCQHQVQRAPLTGLEAGTALQCVQQGPTECMQPAQQAPADCMPPAQQPCLLEGTGDPLQQAEHQQLLQDDLQQQQSDVAACQLQCSAAALHDAAQQLLHCLQAAVDVRCLELNTLTPQLQHRHERQHNAPPSHLPCPQATTQSAPRSACQVVPNALLPAAPVMILFSGGVDSTLIAALAHRALPPDVPIDLANVCFDGGCSADRVAARAAVLELAAYAPTRLWRLIEVDSSLQEVDTLAQHIQGLLQPASTVMDWNIGSALWLATGGVGKVWVPSQQPSAPGQPHAQLSARQQHGELHSRLSMGAKEISSEVDAASAPWRLQPFRASGSSSCSRSKGHDSSDPGQQLHKSAARVVLLGHGADEQCGGYGRHRTKFREAGWLGLAEELRLDVGRLWLRNLGRDDRIIADHGREGRHPFLDERVMLVLQQLPLHVMVDFSKPPGVGDKRVLRYLLAFLGLPEAAVREKRAIQFGSRIGQLSNKRDFGSNRRANKQQAGSLKVSTSCAKQSATQPAQG